MFRKIFVTSLVGLLLPLVVQAANLGFGLPPAGSPGVGMGTSAATPSSSATTPPGGVSSMRMPGDPSLGFDPSIGSMEDPTYNMEGDPTSYEFPSTSGNPGSGTGSGSPSATQQAAATAAAQEEALKEFVLPTSRRHFSLSNLNSDREAFLIIDDSNSQDNLIYRVIRLIGMSVGTIGIILYIIAGYFMIFSQGEENQLTKGKQIAAYNSLGLALVFVAYMIVQLVMGLMYYAG